jgi:flagellar biosynthesis component FlhA
MVGSLVVKKHHVSFTAAGVLLLCALIPPFDAASVLCLAAAAVNFAVGCWMEPKRP